LRREFPEDLPGQVRRALRLASGVPADSRQVERGLRLIRSLQAEHGVNADKALVYYCLVVLNLNEFVYLD